jgi:hypothetical protein
VCFYGVARELKPRGPREHEIQLVELVLLVMLVEQTVARVLGRPRGRPERRDPEVVTNRTIRAATVV